MGAMILPLRLPPVAPPISAPPDVEGGAIAVTESTAVDEWGYVVDDAEREELAVISGTSGWEQSMSDQTSVIHET